MSNIKEKNIKKISYDAEIAYKSCKNLNMAIAKLKDDYRKVDINILKIAIYSIDAYVDMNFDLNGDFIIQNEITNYKARG